MLIWFFAFFEPGAGPSGSCFDFSTTPRPWRIGHGRVTCIDGPAIRTNSGRKTTLLLALLRAVVAGAAERLCVVVIEEQQGIALVLFEMVDNGGRCQVAALSAIPAQRLLGQSALTDAAFATPPLVFVHPTVGNSLG